MFQLTHWERKVLLVIAGLVLLGGTIRFFHLRFDDNIYLSAKPDGSTIRVNINQDSAGQIEQLPGIGPGIAARIIEYRVSNGRFESIETLKKVKGIGTKKLEQIKKFIVL
jgi:comEA protein